MKGLPMQSLTLDNGTEFADHNGISQDLNVTVYFADPLSPWQGGSNEHINVVLRFFFPKGLDFRKLTQQQVDEVAHLLNSKLLKCFGWLSPSSGVALELTICPGSPLGINLTTSAPWSTTHTAGSRKETLRYAFIDNEAFPVDSTALY